MPKFIEGRTFDYAPSQVADAASEAIICLSAGHLRAALLLARSVIEATAKDKGIVSGPLKTKIDEMQMAGLIRPHIKEAAHEVREFGNDMAHGDFIEPVDPADAALALRLMSEILDEVYGSLARVEEARQRRMQRRS